MNDLIIRTRLEALSSTLAEVSDAMKIVRARRADLSKLRELVIDAQERFSDIQAVITKSQKEFGREAQRREGEAAAAKFEQFAKDLEKVNGAITALSDRCLEAESDLNRILGTIKWGEEGLDEFLEAQFKAPADKAITALQKEQRALERAGPDVPETKLRTAWQHYRKLLDETGRPLITEYVDLLGGVALRDSTDAAAFQMTDELIRRCRMIGGAGSARHSLTIPARAEMAEATVARIIRLGLPEWALWAVPLGAAGFGHVVVEADANLPKQLPDVPFAKVYAADAFATCALGPAYACAAIMMRFDPTQAQPDGLHSPPVASRAWVVTTALRKLDAQGGPTTAGPFARVAEQLEAAWTETLALTGQDDAVDDAKALGELVDKVMAFSSVVAYLPKAWQMIDNDELSWPKLLTEADGGDKARILPTSEIRDLLNAAWISRLRNPRKTAVIAEEAEKLRLRLRKLGGSRPDGPIQR